MEKIFLVAKWGKKIFAYFPIITSLFNAVIVCV